jgi:TonB-linked SusC/RagA family outer membrane protein
MQTKKLPILLAFLFMSLTTMSFVAKAQVDDGNLLKGQITSVTGEPLAGASVIVKNGNGRGVVADPDGRYELEARSGEILVFEFLGFIPVEIQVGNQKVINVTLREDMELLDEVVVMGYGTQRKKLITGSTVNVTGEKLAAVNSLDALGALQSQAAGVNITSNSGQPGESYKVTIRGMGTIGSTEPLYVIDGVPGGSITSLSPNDIESIDVLKDAASSAIYGARAANGVILVTTKRGSADSKLSVTYEGYVGIQNPNTNGVTPLDAKQYMEIVNKSYETAGQTPYDFKALIPNHYDDIMSGKWKGTNWLQEATNKNAPIQNHSVNMTGGSDQSRFSLGFSYFGQEGTLGYPAVPNYERYTARINSDYSVLKKNGRDVIVFGENITATLTNKSGIAIGNNYYNSIRDLLVAPPILPAYNKTGEFYEYADMQEEGWDFNQDYANPLAETYYDHGNNRTKGHRVSANFYLQIMPIKDLTIKSSAGVHFSHSDYRRYVPTYTLSGRTSNNTDDVTQNQSYSARWSWENTVNYKKSFGDHNLDLLAGQSLEKWGFGNRVEVKNSNSIFPGSFDHAYINNTQGLDVANTSIGGSPNGQGALSSFFARVNYNYKEKYLFSAVMRADGSSNFAKGHRWGYFPSVSAGWVLSNEDFMSSTKDWMNFLKIRGSWGQNGNCNIAAFQYVATIAFDAPYYFSDKSVSNTGAYPDIMPNENLKWETSEQLDFGVDARFFRSRLGVSFDWYNKMTRDWLVQAPTLLIYGSGAPYINGGDIRNRGYEFLVSWNDNVGDFSYGVSATFSHNDNLVTRLANSEGIIHGEENVIAQNTAELYRVQVDYPIGYFWGYDVEGIIQNETDLKAYLDKHCNGDAANSLQKADIQPGDVKFVDTDGNGIINEEDKTMIGNPNPDYNLGLSINLAYKGFDFSLNGYGAFGQQIAKSYRHFSSKPDENYTTDVFTKYWTKEGSTDRYPRFTHGKHANMGEVSKIWIEDGDYFKISNITFGYDFKKLFKNMPLTRCRLYVSAQNMFTFTQYTGMDPEIGYGDGTEWMSGVDVGNYPTANAWIFGVNLTF